MGNGATGMKSIGKPFASIATAFNQAPRELLVSQSCDFATDCVRNGTPVALAGIGVTCGASALAVLGLVAAVGGVAAWQSYVEKRDAAELQNLIKRAGTQANDTQSLVRELRKQLQPTNAPSVDDDPAVVAAVEAFIKGNVADAAEACPKFVQDVLDAAEQAKTNDGSDLLELARRDEFNLADEVLAQADKLDRFWPTLVAIAGVTEQIRSTQLDDSQKLDDIHQFIKQRRPAGSSAPRHNLAGLAVPNRRFVGRQGHLSQLSTWLADEERPPVLALVGGGGFGKTEIARVVATSALAAFDGVWWLNGLDADLKQPDADPNAAAEAPDRKALPSFLFSGLRDLCRTLGQTVGDQPTDAQLVQALHAGIDKIGGRHLLVLDDVDPIGPARLLCLPGSHRTLFTRRGHAFPAELGRAIDVGKLARQDAVAILTGDRPELRNSDDPALDAICDADVLGDHALAVAQAGKYLGTFDVTPTALLDLLKAQNVDAVVQELHDVDPDLAGTGVGQSIARTVGLLMDRIDDNANGRRLLLAASLVGPDNCPLDLLADALDLSKQEADKAAVKLHNLALLRRDKVKRWDEAEHIVVSTHNLTQRVTVARADAAEVEATGATLRDQLLSIFTTDALDRPQHWPRLDAFAAHAQSLLAKGHGAHTDPSWAVLCNQVAYFAWIARNRHGTALPLFEEAERIDRAAFGNDHTNVARAVNNIGSVLKARGDLAVLAKFEEAERIDRAAFGDDHPTVARVVNNIGGVLQARVDLAGALRSIEEAERIDRAAFGDDHPDVATDVNNIGSVLRRRGDLAGALGKVRGGRADRPRRLRRRPPERGERRQQHRRRAGRPRRPGGGAGEVRGGRADRPRRLRRRPPGRGEGRQQHRQRAEGPRRPGGGAGEV